VYRSFARLLLAGFLVGTLVFGGCLTTNPSVVADTDDSTVFRSVSVDESWATNHVTTNATLRPTSAAGNVTNIAVITENGKPYATEQVASGQRAVVLPLPSNQNATLVASNAANSTTIEKLNVSTTGNTLL
jgi:hypothetical protein